MTLRLSSGTQEALKWLALGLMALDHSAAVFLSGDAYVVARLAGRLAFPLFGALLAYNLVYRRVEPRRYVVPLLLLAVVSQPLYAAVFPGYGLNVFVPLLVGVLIVWACMSVPRGDAVRWLLVLPLGAVVYAGAALADYGLAGVLLVPVWALVLVWPTIMPTLALTGVLVALNWGTVGALVPLLVPVSLAGAQYLDLPLRRPGRWVAYAFYPAHLFVLAVVSLGLKNL